MVCARVPRGFPFWLPVSSLAAKLWFVDAVGGCLRMFLGIGVQWFRIQDLVVERNYRSRL